MKSTLKQKLLDLNFVLDNEYLDQYCDLIVSNMQTEAVPFKTNNHYIVPRHYFSKNNIPVDNTTENIVTLYAFDHVLAHWLLANCSSDKYYFYSNMSTVLYTSTKYNLLPEEFLFSDTFQNKYNQDYADMCNMRSKKYSGEGNPNYGSGTNHGGCFRGHHSEITKKLISDALKGRVSNRKGCEVSQEQREKLSYALKLYYSDSENLLKHSEASKRGWETRRINGTTHTTNGMHHYTNGLDLVYSESCPDGYWPGVPDELRARRSHTMIEYLKHENPEKKQERIQKQRNTVSNWSDEHHEQVIEKIRYGTAAAKSRMTEEQKTVMNKHISEGLERYHANMTEEQKQELRRKNSEGQKGKKRYKNIVTNKRKMFKPGEQPPCWSLIEYDWYIDTVSGKKTRLERGTPHEARYVKIDNNKR